MCILTEWREREKESERELETVYVLMPVCDLTCVTVQFGSAVRNIFLHGLLMAEEMFVVVVIIILLTMTLLAVMRLIILKGTFPSLRKFGLTRTMCVLSYYGFMYVCV